MALPYLQPGSASWPPISDAPERVGQSDDVLAKDSQFVYMLSGWVDLEFEDGQKLRIQSGESLYIPGGLRHNEAAASRDLELLELSVPADMGTVACDPPEGWSKSA